MGGFLDWIDYCCCVNVNARESAHGYARESVHGCDHGALTSADNDIICC